MSVFWKYKKVCLKYFKEYLIVYDNISGLTDSLVDTMHSFFCSPLTYLLIYCLISFNHTLIFIYIHYGVKPAYFNYLDEAIVLQMNTFPILELQVFW